MDEVQVWAVAILLATATFIWFFGYDDVRHPREDSRDRKENNKKR